MELPRQLLEQIAYNTRPKTEEHMLIVMDKSSHEEHLSQALLQTDNKQLRIAITFLTAYNGIFNLTNEINKFYFKKTITNEDGFIKTTTPPGAYKIESLNNEIKRIIIDEEHYTEANYPFTIKPNFSTLGSIIEKSPQGPIMSFMFDDIIKDLLEFNARTLYEEYTPSNNPVDVLSFDNIFIETDIAKGMIFKGKRTGVIHNFTMDADPGYKYIEKIQSGMLYYVMESKDTISSICFKLRNENFSNSIIQRSKYLFSFNNQRNMKVLKYRCLEH